MKTAYPSETLLPQALDLVNQIAPYCTRIALAGSLRRGELHAHDIEIVCEPAGDTLDAWLADQLATGQLDRRRKRNGDFVGWGPRYKAMAWQALPVDLFIVRPDRQWGPTYLIRTGPGEANDSLVTRRGLTNRHGRTGVMPWELRFADGALWTGEDYKTKVDTPEEKDVFAAMGYPYVPPPLRSYRNYLALSQDREIPRFSTAWVDGDDYFVNGERVLMDAPVAKAEAVEAPMEQLGLW